MLFLLNDTVIHLSHDAREMPLDPMRFRALSLTHVVQLGAELFSEDRCCIGTIRSGAVGWRC
jgi:hypothetical protein